MELQMFKILTSQETQGKVTLVNIMKLDVEVIIRNLGWMIEAVILENFFIIAPEENIDQFDSQSAEELYEEIILTFCLSTENKYTYSTLNDKYKIIRILANTLNVLSSIKE